MRRDPVRPPLEPARRDCRQLTLPGFDYPPWVIIGRLVSFPGLRPHAQARAGWAAPRFAAVIAALWAVTFTTIGVSADAHPPSTWVALKPLPHHLHSSISPLPVYPSPNHHLIPL